MVAGAPEDGFPGKYQSISKIGISTDISSGNYDFPAILTNAGLDRTRGRNSSERSVSNPIILPRILLISGGTIDFFGRVYSITPEHICVKEPCHQPLVRGKVLIFSVLKSSTVCMSVSVMFCFSLEVELAIMLNTALFQFQITMLTPIPQCYAFPLPNKVQVSFPRYTRIILIIHASTPQFVSTHSPTAQHSPAYLLGARLSLEFMFASDIRKTSG